MADYTKVVKHTVKSGDTLSEIAYDNFATYGKKLGYSNYKDYMNKFIAKQNDIENINLIMTGEKLIIYSPKGKTVKSTSTKKTSSKKATINRRGFVNGTNEKTLFVTWTWSKHDDTEEYKTRWKYSTGDGVSWVGDDGSSGKNRYSMYDIPSNATSVWFYVKPVAKKDTKKNKNGKEVTTARFSGVEWSDKWSHNVTPKPGTPSAPTITIEGTKLTATYKVGDVDPDSPDKRNVPNYVQFRIFKNNSTKAYKTSEKIKISNGQASWTYNVSTGAEFKVRCRTYCGAVASDLWGPDSNVEKTIPANVARIEAIAAKSKTSVLIDWSHVTAAESYEIEYTTQKSYFDRSDSVQKKTLTIDPDSGTHPSSYLIEDLESGREYFFRVRAVNAKGASAWTAIKSIILGTRPEAPTSWSSTTTLIAGESLTLYWTHNTEDGSAEQATQLYLKVGNADATTTTISDPTKEDEEEGILSKAISTSGYSVGTTLKWKVRTRGVYEKFNDDGTLNENKTYSDWSTLRTVQIYSQPTVDLEVFDSREELCYRVEYDPEYEPVKDSNDEILYYVGAYVTTDELLDGDLGGSRFQDQTTIDGDQIYSVDIDGETVLYRYEYTFGDSVDTLTSLPVCIRAKAPSTSNQKAIGYHLSIMSKSDYDTEDELGNFKMVKKGDVVFSKQYDKPVTFEDGIFIGPQDVDLASSAEYVVKVIASMSSGLTAEATHSFDVEWSEQDFEPGAEIGIDKDTLAAVIQPHCDYYEEKYLEVETRTVLDEVTGETVEVYTIVPNSIQSPRKGAPIEDAYAEFSDGAAGEDLRGQIDEGMYPVYEAADIGSAYYTVVQLNTKQLVPDIRLSVYRREYDGTFTAIAEDLANTYSTYVVDPHPSLDLARYRIVATSKTTGAVGYWDLPGHPVGEHTIVIQWDEQWTEFDTDDGNSEEDKGWGGSMLKLPYDISVSDSNSPDVELVEYIGRENPVAYYGTQQGYSSTWSTNVPKDDKETLYALRRLQRWMGDVYVREPSGSGYWANITVQFSQKSKDLVIPVTLNIKRVEGGA